MAAEALFHGASFANASCQSASTPAKFSSLYSEIIGIELPAATLGWRLPADRPLGPRSGSCPAAMSTVAIRNEGDNWSRRQAAVADRVGGRRSWAGFCRFLVDRGEV